MGARIVYIFKTEEDGPNVALYSHWGQDSWQHDIAAALQHARPRWNDSSYGTRMMISYLMQDQILDETGFGVFAVNGEDSSYYGEQTVVIDFINKLVIDNVPVTWDAFINAYSLTTIGV